MSLNIKNEEAETLARRLAGETGESVTRAVTTALRERLERLEKGRADARAEKLEAIRRIAEDAATRWVEPYKSMDHADFLYDERGLPK